MIIYFTGTGNSRYLAGLLADKLGEELIDAPALIKENIHPDFSSATPYILVAPAYAWRLPRVFEDWLKKCSFAGDRRLYVVMDCGSSIGGAGSYAQKLSARLGLEYMGTAGVVMPENYIAVFAAPGEKKAAKIIAKAKEKTLALADIIKNREPFTDDGPSPIGYMCSSIVNNFFYRFTIGDKKFFVTDKCVSCGRCAENCMLNNITLSDGKPQWGGDCTHCMACICRCPTAAIEYGRHTKKLRRYTCPEE